MCRKYQVSKWHNKRDIHVKKKEDYSREQIISRQIKQAPPFMLQSPVSILKCLQWPPTVELVLLDGSVDLHEM